MSQANVLASYCKLLIAAAGIARTAAGLASLDTDITSPQADPYPSLRMHILNDGVGTLEGILLVQNDLRIPVALLDEWGMTILKRKFLVSLGFQLNRQDNRTALAPLYNFQASDNPSTPIGTFRMELAGSTTWRARADGPDIQLVTLPLNLFFEGD